MVEVGMNKIVESFLSNQWNIYGLQILCGSLMVMVLSNYLSFVGMCCIGLCVYLIAICQRILGVRYGMVFYETNQYKMEQLIKQIKKEKEEDE